jgi:hypothetical protein
MKISAEVLVASLLLLALLAGVFIVSRGGDLFPQY